MVVRGAGILRSGAILSGAILRSTREWHEWISGRSHRRTTKRSTDDDLLYPPPRIPLLRKARDTCAFG